MTEITTFGSGLASRTGSDHPEPSTVRRATVAASLGTAVEYYDFAVYAFMASIIAPLFFPSDDDVVALLLTFAAFASSYLVRPLGAVIFGPLGDKYGRRNVLSVVILIMAVATTSIGLLPTYAQVGVLAPILLTLARLIQGLSIGGEFGGAASYLGEFAPPRSRAFHLGWLVVAIGGGLLTGVLVASGVSQLIGQDDLESWGWRIPFLLALPMGVIGVYLRSRLGDTPHFQSIASSDLVESSPLLTSLRTNYRGIGLSIGLLAGMTVSTYLYLIYAPSYLVTVVGFDRNDALVMSAVATALFCVAAPVLAHLCDVIGRRPVFAVTIALLTVLTYPGFAIIDGDDPLAAGAALTVLALLTAGSYVSVVPMLVELFATSTRFTSLGLGWNIAAALFGGAAPLIATSLIAATGQNAAPAFYGIAGCVLSLIAVAFVKETVGIELRADDEFPASDRP